MGFSSITAFLPLYVKDLGTHTSLSVEVLSGLAFSTQAVTMMIAAPIWGALADRRGRKLMVERATFGGAVVVLLMGFVRSAEELILLRAVQGMITGVLSANTALVAASVPRERSGYALGLLQVGLWGGISAGPLMGGLVVDLVSYRAAFIVTMVLCVFAGILVVWGVDEHFQPLPAAPGSQNGFWASWRHVLSMPGVPQTFLMRFLNGLGRSLTVPFIPLIVAALLAGSERAASTTGIVTGAAALAGTIAAVYMGTLSDRIGPRPVLIGSALTAALFYLPQGAVSSIWQLLILQVLTGAMAGGILPTLSTLLVRYTQPGEEGAVYGLDSSIASGANATAPMLGSALVYLIGLRGILSCAGIVFLVMALIALRGMPEVRVLPRSQQTDPCECAQPAKAATD